jgi:calnexin
MRVECGGAYLKLLHADNFSPEQLSNETRYIIMFGPDRCGVQCNIVQLVFRCRDPKTGSTRRSG